MKEIVYDNDMPCRDAKHIHTHSLSHELSLEENSSNKYLGE